MLDQSVTKSNCLDIEAVNETLSHSPLIEAADMSDLSPYGNQHQIVEATAENNEVVVTWRDGHVSRFHYGWLRENCAHPSSRHVKARERLVQPLSISESIRPLRIAVDGSGALWIMWNEADKTDPSRHYQSRFHPGWLRAHCYTHPSGSSNRAAKAAELQPAYLKMRDAPWEELISSDEALYHWLRELAHTGWAVVKNVPHEEGACVRFGKRIGIVRESNFGYLFDVKSKANPNSNAYTSFHLPLHTDMPHYELPPGIQLLHSMVNSAHGGESLLVDGLAVADCLKREHPNAFQMLTTQTIPYRFQDDDSDYVARHLIIECDHLGDPLYINWSNSTSAPLDIEHSRMEAMRSAIRLFIKTLENPRFLIKRKLDAGEMLVFDNRRMLHGRNAFDTTTGDRHLQGCYLDTSEFRSRLNVFARRFGSGSKDEKFHAPI